jgi:hypothetical protein
MAVDERSRKELYEKLGATLGPRPADTAMELLPPVGWADVATKQDVTTAVATAKQEVINTMTWRMFVMLLAIVGVVAAFVVPLYG